MNKNIINFSLLILMFISLFVSFGCDKEEEVTIDANYINEHLDASVFKTLNYKKEIMLSDTLLYSETFSYSYENNLYKIIKNIKELNPDLTADSLYVETTEEEESSNLDNPITLEVKNEYFSEVTVNEKFLSGKVNEANTKDVLKIDGVKDVNIEITLNDDLKVDYIKISYIDTVSNFNVIVSAKYSY